jgi:hypothetical protein
VGLLSTRWQEFAGHCSATTAPASELGYAARSGVGVLSNRWQVGQLLMLRVAGWAADGLRWLGRCLFCCLLCCLLAKCRRCLLRVKQQSLIYPAAITRSGRLTVQHAEQICNYGHVSCILRVVMHASRC